MELFLTPNGRIDQPTYWRAVWILFAISSALSAVSAFVSPFLGMLGLIFIWPWIAVHVKRFHDSGKTGWLTVAMVVLAIVVSFVANAALLGAFGLNSIEAQMEMQRQIEDAASADPSTAITAAMEATKQMAQAQLLPSILSTALVTAIVGFVMGLINKTDPQENQYGPGPGGPAVTFN
jgi:uncharacterized membrane protein YhaH (DUF805 family)